MTDWMKIIIIKRAGFLLVTIVAGLFCTLPAYASNAFNGKPLYEKHCADCHEESGKTWVPTAPNFRKREKLNMPDNMLVTPIMFGKGTMPAFKGILKDKEIMDVIAYIRTLM